MSDNRVFTEITPYTQRFTQSGQMSINIETSNFAKIGSYQLKVIVWDGGDGTYETKVNEITGTPTLELFMYDPRVCYDG